MNLALTDPQVEELEALLQLTLRELTHEITATENPKFRAGLMARRDRLTEIHDMVDRQLHVPATFDDAGVALERELARPGD